MSALVRQLTERDGEARREPVEDEQVEKFVVTESDAIGDPRAVVVHLRPLQDVGVYVKGVGKEEGRLV